jgi:hypothetical protein
MTGRIWNNEKSNDLIGNPAHNLPGCSIARRILIEADPRFQYLYLPDESDIQY